MNSLLTDSNSAFQPEKTAALKGGVLAATGIAQYLLIRKWPPLIKLFSIVNFGASGPRRALPPTTNFAFLRLANRRRYRRKGER